MTFVSVSCANSSPAHCSLYISLCLSFLLTSTLLTASDQMPRCAELQFDAESASAWDYCVDETPATRNWYQAMADCRRYNGELVSLEWREKIDDIQVRLSGRGVNLSSGVFVNAHRPFYSANNQFAWSSGIELPLEVDTAYMEECVKYSSIGLRPITCDSDVEAYPLVCQRVSPRIVGTSELESLLLSAQKLNFSRKTINYSAESCDYFSLGRFGYSWYQAKRFCETISYELLGIPREQECRLIDENVNLRVNLNNPKFSYLNIHLKMYARNESTEKFRDFSGKTINDSFCGWSEETLERAIDKYCVVFNKGKTISSIDCNANSPYKLVGFICKQCRLNTYSYVRRIDHTNTRTSEWTSTRVTITPAASIAHSSFSTPETQASHTGFLLLFPILIVFSLSVVLNVVLVVALMLCIMRNRTRVAAPLPTAFRPDSNPRPESYDCYDNEHLRDEGEWDTCDTNAPPHQRPGETYANYEYSEPTEFVESWATRVEGRAEAQTRLLSNSSSTNEQHRPPGKEFYLLVSYFHHLQILHATCYSTPIFAQMLALHTCSFTQ